MIKRSIHLFSALCLGVFLSCNAQANTEKTGDILQVLIPSAAFASTFYMDDSEGRTAFYKSFATNVISTYGLKKTIRKQRPNNGNRDSFPSGHTSAAFQGASFIHFRYGWQYAVPAYLGAAFVGYSRVDAEKHYTVDVLAGAALGVLSSWYFTEPFDNGLHINTDLKENYYGLSLSYPW
ncbi:PAP2 family protein [Endozoicomonas sp. OPT23]|uniref:phosphatase PAP2 family protein n=1 Tax=Endozoicomonas sp. OPT23 TaxID=2072845 RepID=UPI00129AE445|nr:phosphatase PAP2 family protein [Endozoicomonas sp. OPT23]MRI33443.1 PAP2 family protein [Endozoicomonas sp. OPT23]